MNTTDTPIRYRGWRIVAYPSADFPGTFNAVGRSGSGAVTCNGVTRDQAVNAAKQMIDLAIQDEDYQFEWGDEE